MGYATAELPLRVEASTGAGLADALDDAGVELQVVNWVYEKFAHENLVETLIAPLTGDFEKIAHNADAWRAVGASMTTITDNLSSNVAEVRDSWSGRAAGAHEGFIQGPWRAALAVEGAGARRVATVFDRIATTSLALAKRAVGLVEKLVQRLRKVAGRGLLGVIGIPGAIKDAIKIVQSIKDIIRQVKSLISTGVRLLGAISRARSALRSLPEVNSVSDVVNAGTELDGARRDARG